MQTCGAIQRASPSVLPPTCVFRLGGCAMAKWTAGKGMMKWDAVSSGCGSHVTSIVGVTVFLQ